MREVTVSLRLAQGNKVRFDLAIDGGVPTMLEARKRFLPLPDLDELMRGELAGPDGEAIVERIQVGVSSWFLGKDLTPAINVSFAGAEGLVGPQVRLVFNPDGELESVMNFSTVPMELLTPLGGPPYSLDARVAAVVHVLQRGKAPEPAATSLYWPLRVLVFRANPSDRDLVPPASPVKDRINELAQAANGAVDVHLVSSEAGVDRPATFDALRDALLEPRDPYDILVFMGHGNVIDDGWRPRPALRFETPGGGGIDITAARIATALENFAPPIVLLVACLSADQVAMLSPDDQSGLNASITRWMRGNQGVAQALVSSETAHVQVVVGMRYRLGTLDASAFLDEFFRSLLIVAPGNVEAAVRAARTQLSQTSRFPAAYSAPVIFRGVGAVEEPILPFLAETMPGCSLDPGAGSGRDIAWADLLGTPWSRRTAGSKETAFRFLKAFDQKLIDETTAKPGQSLLLPELATARPDMIVVAPGETVTMRVQLHGAVPLPALQSLVGRLRVSGGAQITRAVGTPEVAAAGYDVLTREIDADLEFSLRPTDGNEQVALADLPILEFQVKLGDATATRYEVAVHAVTSLPVRAICPTTNALLVPPS